MGLPCGGRPCDPDDGSHNILQCVTRKTVYIALTLAVSHDLEVKEADVLNACVMVPNIEKIKTVLGPEVVDYAGKSVHLPMHI